MELLCGVTAEQHEFGTDGASQHPKQKASEKNGVRKKHKKNKGFLYKRGGNLHFRVSESEGYPCV